MNSFPNNTPNKPETARDIEIKDLKTKIADSKHKLKKFQKELKVLERLDSTPELVEKIQKYHNAIAKKAAELEDYQDQLNKI